MKTTAYELELHTAVLEKNDIALSKLYNSYGQKLVRILKYRYASAFYRDETLIYEAVNEAFQGYYRNPMTFCPERNSLFNFLLVAADRDLINIFQREKKHSNRKNVPEDVELEENFWNTHIKPHDSTDDTIQIQETLTAVQNLLESFFSNDKDVKLAWMVLASERDTESYSEVLKIEKLSIHEQRNEVKKHKDRIKKVLERNDVGATIKSFIQ